MLILQPKINDINIQDKYGDATLIYAVRSKHIDIVKLLIAAGVDINAID